MTNYSAKYCHKTYYGACSGCPQSRQNKFPWLFPDFSLTMMKIPGFYKYQTYTCTNTIKNKPNQKFNGLPSTLTIILSTPLYYEFTYCTLLFWTDARYDFVQNDTQSPLGITWSYVLWIITTDIQCLAKGLGMGYMHASKNFKFLKLSPTKYETTQSSYSVIWYSYYTVWWLCFLTFRWW